MISCRICKALVVHVIRPAECISQNMWRRLISTHSTLSRISCLAHLDILHERIDSEGEGKNQCQTAPTLDESTTCNISSAEDRTSRSVFASKQESRRRVWLWRNGEGDFEIHLSFLPPPCAGICQGGICGIACLTIDYAPTQPPIQQLLHHHLPSSSLLARCKIVLTIYFS